MTAREYGQTEGILDRLGIPYTSVGRHGGALDGRQGARARRAAARGSGAGRGGRGFDLALAHGSVDIAVVARALRIPLAQMNDYEHAGLQRRLAFAAARAGDRARRDPGRGDGAGRGAGAERSSATRA